jgi:hypothetical protein
MNAKKNKDDQQSIQNLMEQLQKGIRCFEGEFRASDDPPLVKFIRNEGKIWTLKYDKQTFRLNIEVEP